MGQTFAPETPAQVADAVAWAVDAEIPLEIVGADLGRLSGDTGDWPQMFLGSFANTLGGGTSEVMRNIIGERHLGLPR